MSGFERKVRRKNQVDVKSLGLPRHKAQLEAAFNKGYEAGEKVGVNKSIDYMSEKIQSLSELKGIGEKTVEIVARHFGFKLNGEKDGDNQ